jgi:hypothetical protein
VAGFCEQGDEITVSRKCKKTLLAEEEDIVRFSRKILLHGVIS